jgi:SAM-dependent methyltransferase
MNQWDRAAKMYEKAMGDTGDPPHRLLFDPLLRKHMGNIKGKRILDLGCGNGYWVKKLARTAKHVVGIDNSRELLIFARLRTQHLKNVRFLERTLEKRLLFSSQIFDTVFSSMALHYVRNIHRLFYEVFRVLHRNGIFIFLIPHPFYVYDRHLRGASTYKARKKTSARILVGKIPVTFYHRPLDEYFAAAEQARLKLIGFEEVVVSKSLAKKYPDYAKRIGFPVAALWKLKK